MDRAGLGALLKARVVLDGNLRPGGLPWSLQRILELSGRRDALAMGAAGAPERDRLAGHAAAGPLARVSAANHVSEPESPRPDSTVRDGRWR